MWINSLAYTNINLLISMLFFSCIRCWNWKLSEGTWNLSVLVLQLPPNLPSFKVKKKKGFKNVYSFKTFSLEQAFMNMQPIPESKAILPRIKWLFITAISGYHCVKLGRNLRVHNILIILVTQMNIWCGLKMNSIETNFFFFSKRFGT